MMLVHALSFAFNKLIKYFLASLKCHLLVPSLIVNNSPISLWLYPSVIYRLNTALVVADKCCSMHSTCCADIRSNASAPMPGSCSSFHSIDTFFLFCLRKKSMAVRIIIVRIHVYMDDLPASYLSICLKTFRNPSC